MKTSITHNSSCHKYHSNSGFTLIELIVTVAILAIIVGFAAPNITIQLANQRVKSATATLANALKEAKSESIIRRQPLTVSYNNTNPRTIKIENIVNSAIESTIGTYTFNDNITIQSVPDSPATVIFEPGKHVSAAITYTICDSSGKVGPRQITVNSIANITTKMGGTC